MLNLKKHLKDWFNWLVFISIIAIILILYWYFNSHGPFENKAADWGDFGSILAAVIGLIAFIGVLFTLRQSKQQFTNSEDRAIFFELLKIFISYRDSLRVIRIDWKYNHKNHQWDITQSNEFCPTERTYQQIYGELYHSFYLEIRKGIPENFSKDEFIKKNIPSNCSEAQWLLTYGPLAIAINYIYDEYNWEKNGGMMEIPSIPLNAYDYLCLNAIKFYLEQNNMKPITKAYAKAADQCLEIYKNQLGTYFNNAYNIVNMVSEFAEPTKYIDIFRAQLSKNELAILFFYSFSSFSTPQTRNLYLKNNLFKDLDLRDIRLKEQTINKSVSREIYIKFSSYISQVEMKDEYVSYNTLKKMYDCIEIKKQFI